MDVADSDVGYDVSEDERQAAREEWWLAVKKRALPQQRDLTDLDEFHSDEPLQISARHLLLLVSVTAYVSCSVLLLLRWL